MKTRTAFSLLASITLLVSLFGISGAPVLAANTVVKISPATGSVVAGQTVAINVSIEGAANLYGAEVHITFDPALLEVIDADGGTDGVQIGHGGFLSPNFVAQNQANNATGGIDYAISQMPPKTGVNGNGALATITFRGKAAGTSAVNITTALLADPNGAQIPSTTQNGSLTVSGSATPSPAPTASPSPSPSPTTTPVPTPGPGVCSHIQGYHTVRVGETLYAIGRAYATKPASIASCNGIVNANRLYVGARLAIPVDPWSPVPPGPTAQRQFTPGGTPVPTPVPTPTPACRYYHMVRYGETLSLIAWRYGVSMWAIARANNIYNLNLIYAGQVLCIP